MSSLRLALKQSLQETGHLFKEKKKKSSGKATKADARRRRPGDPPRKRGRPRKTPAPDDDEPARTDQGELKASDGDEGTESENEFSYDSEEEEDDSDEGEVHDDDDEEEHDNNNNEHHRKEEDHSGMAPDEEDSPAKLVQSTAALPISKSEAENSLQDDMDQDDERKRQKKLIKKNLQQAANKIQAQWKKKTGISRGKTESSFDESNGIEEIEGRSHSPMRSRDVSSNNSTPTNGNDKKKKKDGPTKTQTVPPPEPEILEWSRSLSEKKSRKHITSGLRVKVRFAAKVKRDGKVVKKKIWYGGRVSAVSKEGSKIRIKYDDGTSEIAKFPDKDVVVDDKFNGKHLVPADKFVPPAREENFVQDQADQDPIDDLGDVEPNHEYQEETASSKLPESVDAKRIEEHQFAQVRETSTDNPSSLGTEQASPVHPPEVVRDEEDQTKDATAALESPSVTMELHSNQPNDRLSATVPPDNNSHAVVTPKPNTNESTIDADIATVGDRQLSRSLSSQDGEELSSPGLSVIIGKPSSPESKGADEDHTQQETREIAATLEVLSAQKTTEGQWGTSNKNQSDSEPDKTSSMKSSGSEDGVAKSSDPVSTKDTQAKPGSPSDASPSSSKRTLTIRISNKIDVPAPDTPRIDSDSDEELLADTPITERKVKSILLKGKGKRKRDVDVVGEENPSKKRINLKREKPEEPPTSLLLPPTDASVSTSRPVDVLGAIEALSALAGAGADPKDAESKKPHITINLRKAEPEQDDPTTVPKVKKMKERSASPTLKGRISPAPRARSRPPTPVTEVAHAIESEADGGKPTNPVETSNTAEPLSRSPKPTKVVARIKNMKHDTSETSQMDERIDDGDENTLSLVRSKDSAESLPNMRSGRRAAQQAKEKMNPKQEDKTIELGKKKKKRKRLEGEDGGDVSDVSVDDRQWVQCDSCGKWRILPSNVKISSLPKHWYCHLNTYDPKRNNCTAPEQTAKQAAKEWRKQRKRAKQQRLIEMQEVEAPKMLEEQQVDSAPVLSPKPPKGIKKDKLESKRTSPIVSEEVVDSNLLPDVSKLEKKPKKGKQNQPPEELPEVPSIPVPVETEGKKPGRKRGRPARNTPNKESEDSENVEWVQCEKCEKWRKLPPHISADELPDTWYCTMNTWNPDSASCGAPEDKADATHHEVGNYAGIFGAGAGKYSYRTMIFGNGKKHNRPMSERSRAAESLFMRPIDEIENPYPTVMYSKSSCFLPRTSNFTKANVIEEETTPSIFDVLSNSQLWAELRTVGQPLQVSSGIVRPLSDRTLTYDNIPESAKQAMREIVLRSLGEKTVTGDELIVEIQRHPWENFAPDVASIRGYFNGDIIVNTLLGLVRDGVVEMTTLRNFKVPIGQWVPKYRKVRSLRAMKIEESIKSSRCMKIAKPWKQRECNTDWITGGSAFS